MKAEDNVILISGSDEAEIKVDADKTIRQLAGDNPDPFAFDVITEGEEVNAAKALQQTLNSIMSPPFFGDRKTVWLKNFSSLSQESKKASKGSAGAYLNELAEKIKSGIPEDIKLVLSGPGIDKRKSLYKTCNDCGTVRLYEKPDIKDRHWRQKMLDILRQRTANKNIKVSAEAEEYLIDIMGTDTARLESELEKLIVYCGGEGAEATLDDVQAICSGEGETISWQLRDAVGQRDIKEALDIINSLLTTAGDPEKQILGLVIQTANAFRHMLQARILMYQEKIRSYKQIYPLIKGLTAEKKEEYQSSGIEIVTMHPFRVQKLAEHAGNYEGNELLGAIINLRDVYRLCVTGTYAKRAHFEKCLVDICSNQKGKGL